MKTHHLNYQIKKIFIATYTPWEHPRSLHHLQTLGFSNHEKTAPRRISLVPNHIWWKNWVWWWMNQRTHPSGCAQPQETWSSKLACKSFVSGAEVKFRSQKPWQPLMPPWRTTICNTRYAPNKGQSRLWKAWIRPPELVIRVAWMAATALGLGVKLLSLRSHESGHPRREKRFGEETNEVMAAWETRRNLEREEKRHTRQRARALHFWRAGDGRPSAGVLGFGTLSDRTKFVYASEVK